MIIIYNTGGLLLALGGLGLAVTVGLLTRSLTVGLVLTSLLWIIFGWRRKTAPDEPRSVSPSVFFVPLRIWGILLLLLTPPLFLVERIAKNRSRDPREASLRADIATLRTTQFAGNAALSRLVHDAIDDIAVDELKAEDYRVFSRIDGSKALVIVEAEDLKQFSDQARTQLLDLIEAVVTLSQAGVDSLYIGVRGRLSFGALRTPGKGTETGSVVTSLALLDFYSSSPPATAPVATPTGSLQFHPGVQSSTAPLSKD